MHCIWLAKIWEAPCLRLLLFASLRRTEESSMRTRGLAPLGSQSMRETCATLPIYQTSQIFRGFLTSANSISVQRQDRPVYSCKPDNAWICVKVKRAGLISWAPTCNASKNITLVVSSLLIFDFILGCELVVIVVEINLAAFIHEVGQNLFLYKWQGCDFAHD